MKWIAFIPLLLIGTLSSANTCGRFQAIEILENESAHSPALGDFNGDGKQDLALLKNKRVDVRFGNGDATFQPVQVIRLPHDAFHMMSGDFNDDRFDDLALAEKDAIRVLLFDRTGQVQSAFSIPTGIASGSLIAADFTGDGVPDLAGFGGSAGILLLVCDGKGHFARPRKIAAGPIYTVLAGDLNDDGRKDLVVIRYRGYRNATVTGLMNQGKGIFRFEAHSLSLLEALQFSLVDTNGDGMEDLLFGTEPTMSDVLGLVIRKSDGYENPVYLHEPDSVRAIRSVDMNRDGRPDVLYISDTGRFVVRLSLPNGRLTAPKISGAVAGVPRTIAIGDLNSDGWPDAVLTGEYATQVMTGNGAGGFHAARSIGFGAGSVATADFNRDGWIDVAVSESNIEILLGRPNSQFQRPFFIGTGVGNNGNLLSLDLNRDGNADLAAGGEGLSVLLGNGDGTFRPPHHYRFHDVSNGNLIASGDFNGDHVPDLAVRDSDSIAILLGNGDGSFSARTLPQEAYSFDALDLNQDGLTDIITGNNGVVSFQLSLGDGNFRTVQTLPVQDATRYAVVDLDQNGRVDLIIGRYDHPALVLPGNGDGTYGEPWPLTATGLHSGYFVGAVSDYDVDGRPDFLSGSVVFLNRIDPADSTQPWRFETRSYVGAFDAVPADVNRDGAPDLVSPAIEGNSGVLLNRGCGLP